jgi:hypothetical protein
MVVHFGFLISDFRSSDGLIPNVGARHASPRATRWVAPTKKTITYKFISLLCILCLVIAGCGDGNPFEDQDSVPAETPGALTALQFPTADGSSWTYTAADGHTYTAEVAGTRNIGGVAVRIMQSDSDVPADYIASLYGIPVRNSFFTKNLNSYTEHALELWLDFLDDIYFQRNSPKRVLWSFPIYEGKEWIVSKSLTVPEFTYTRKVISSGGVLTVPAGTYSDVYYVEEYFSVGDLPPDVEFPNKYWLAPDVGVIKYEYPDVMFETNIVYELSHFEQGRWMD